MQLEPTASLSMPTDPAGAPVLELAGAWTLAGAGRLAAALATLPTRTCAAIDARQLTRLDTTGALLLLRTLARCGLPLAALEQSGMAAAQRKLVHLVDGCGHDPLPERDPHQGFSDLLARTGAAVTRAWQGAVDLLAFVGATLLTLFQVLRRKRRLRLTSVVFHMEQTGLDAVPIVALLTFLVGAVVAFLGATVLRDFGASIFTVELVAYSFLREFGVLLAAILLAGRSGSAFTAQIGSMQSREEIDAIRALGLDPLELLVLPRTLALMLMLPALTFIAMLSGICGGALVGSLALDITPGMFITRLHEMTEARHFFVGMVKAPVFAFLIAVVGCLEGFKVQGSAESVGRHTTSAVVQSIFLVILFDALFAIFFMELDL